MHDILSQLANKSITKEELSKKLVVEPDLIPYVIEGMTYKPAIIKFGSSKALLILSENKPELLYPFFDDLVIYLNHENNILRYGMIFIIANLTPVDKNGKFNQIYADYFSVLKQPILIPAANVVKASSAIIKAKPELANKIVEDLLKINNYEYETSECKNIIIGHTISTFHQNMALIDSKYRNSIISLVKLHQNNTRSGTRKRAVKFLKKYNS